MSEAKSQNFLHGAAILTVSVAIIKVLGMLYKIPLGNILGDEGYGHFLVAYNIYTVLLTLSTAGLPVALSRLISEAHTLGKELQVRRTFRVSMVTFVVFGAVGSLAMFLFPTELAAMMDDVEAAQSIWVLSPAIIFVCIMSAYRGFAQGHSNMKPTAASQVIEVAVKVAFGLALAWVLAKAGNSLPILSAAAISGVAVGSIVACAYIFIEIRRSYKFAPIPAGEADIPDKRSKIFASLIKIGVPIALGSSVSSIINLIDTKLVLNRLQFAAGYTSNVATSLFGVYGKAMTFYNLPSTFITPLTISVVPAIAACMAANKIREATSITESSLRISCILALPMGVGMCVMADPIMKVFYPGSAAEGPILLAVMGLASFFVCLALMTTAILQAYGEERLPMYAIIIGGVVKVAINYILIGIPSIGIYGAPIGTICCYTIMCAINYYFISRKTKDSGGLRAILLRPLLSSIVMGAAAYGTYYVVSRFLGSSKIMLLLSMCLGIGIAVIIYLALIIATKSITTEDTKLIPGFDKVARILHIK